MEDDKRLGRPSNKSLSKSPGKGLTKPGPKAGDAAILAEYKNRMLTSPKSRRVLDAILDAALDNEHRHQAVAWKIIADRILPLAGFDPKRGGAGGVKVSIHISGMAGPATGEDEPGTTIEEAEYEDISEEDE